MTPEWQFIVSNISIIKIITINILGGCESTTKDPRIKLNL